MEESGTEWAMVCASQRFLNLKRATGGTWQRFVRLRIAISGEIW